MPRPPRLVSSLTVAHILTALSLISLIPYVTHATDADSIAHDDHNHLRIRDSPNHGEVSGTIKLMQEEESRSYEPNFAGLDRSILGRAPDRSILQINTTATADIDKNDTHTWIVRSTSNARSLSHASLLHGERDKGDFHDLLKRQDGWWMNLTLSVCNISNLDNDEPPALRLDISRSDSLSDPYGNITTDQGFGTTFVEVTSDLHISVYVDSSSNFEGTYNYELTASTNFSYAGLVVLDSDNHSALLASEVGVNISSPSPGFPYDILVLPHDSLLSWIPNSTCALKKKLTQIQENSSKKSITSNFTTGVTKLGPDTKQLFHVTGLNPGTSYWAIENRSQGSADRGFEVFKPIKFTTKSNSNCAVIYNLSFCTDTAYAVPYNPSPSSGPILSELASFYDNHTQLLYENFTWSLQQIPCNTTSSAQYSLARNCNDCKLAYKSWLCAVTIPRCQDFSASDEWLRPRSVSQPFWNGTTPAGVDMNDLAFTPENKTRRVMNSSRNPLIDQKIQPGPWKEVLPCEDLCYDLVRSCPAALQFGCPTGKWLEYSYGIRGKGVCNDPRVRSNAPGRVGGTNVLGALVVFGLILVLQLGGHV
ncbi:stretch-activated cation channel mid1 [Pseudocyphellaria aurata]|nr:stretch-activated cation channel mid1 [Pseudocyphellaria aurata]